MKRYKYTNRSEEIIWKEMKETIVIPLLTEGTIKMTERPEPSWDS
jgi:hypothetical protein